MPKVKIFQALNQPPVKIAGSAIVAPPVPPDPFQDYIFGWVHGVGDYIQDVYGRPISVNNSYVTYSENMGCVVLNVWGTGVIEYGFNGEFNFLHDNSTDWTIDFFTYIGATSGRWLFRSYTDGDTDSGVGMYLSSFGAPTATFIVKKPGDVCFSAEVSIDGLVDYDWIHFEIGYRKAFDRILVFVNGQYLANVARLSPVSVAASKKFYLGGQSLYQAMYGSFGPFRITQALRHTSSFTPPERLLST